MNIADIFDKVQRYIGVGTNWGRWVGAFIIATILFLWVYLSLKKETLIALDLTTATILLIVFVLNATQRPPVVSDPQTKLPGI